MHVAEVMTTDVLTVRLETTLKDVARLLGARGISGLPVVDDDGRVLGVVSEADILAKERRPAESRGDRGRRRSSPERTKAEARTVAEAMTAPAITITADHRVDGAAALMLDCRVNRLPVVDGDGHLVGIVTRADLVRAFAATDESIDHEIREEVLLRELWLDPGKFELTVEDGIVQLAGQFADAEQREIVARRLKLVPGVVSVSLRETAIAG